jgi:glutamate decarboxylase
MPPNREDLVIMRILVRHGFSRDLADLLVDDLKRCIDYFKKNPVVNQGNEQDSGSFKHS